MYAWFDVLANVNPFKILLKLNNFSFVAVMLLLSFMAEQIIFQQHMFRLAHWNKTDRAQNK